jgi:hypothetical protein
MSEFTDMANRVDVDRAVADAAGMCPDHSAPTARPRAASSTVVPLEPHRGGRSGVAARRSFIGQAVGSAERSS